MDSTLCSVVGVSARKWQTSGHFGSTTSIGFLTAGDQLIMTIMGSSSKAP